MTKHHTDTSTAVRTPAIRVFAAALIAGSALLAAATNANPARAATPTCMDRGILAQQLDKKFSEDQVAVGLTNSGQMVEVFSSGDGATWTIVMTRADGTSCVMATGQAWHGQKRINIGDPA